MVEWGSTRASALQRSRMEACLGRLRDSVRPELELAATGDRYMAQIRSSTSRGPVVLRLHDDSVDGLIERVADLLGVVATSAGDPSSP